MSVSLETWTIQSRSAEVCPACGRPFQMWANVVHEDTGEPVTMFSEEQAHSLADQWSELRGPGRLYRAVRYSEVIEGMPHSGAKGA